MSIAIYILSSISILLAVGGLSAYWQTKSISLLMSSLVSIAFSVLAMVLIHWWPLVVGFAVNWGIKVLGSRPDTAE